LETLQVWSYCLWMHYAWLLVSVTDPI
jgi:hypothetical protein